MSEHYEVVCDSRDPEWKSKRGEGIGASEAAVLLGLSPWKSLLQLYGEKTREIPAPDLDDVELVQWGNRLEPVIIEAYREKTRRFVDRGGILLRSRQYPWALATLDAWTCTDELGPYWPLEIKSTGAHKGEEWAEGPPEHYRAQIHWQMLVMNTQRATIACLIGGQRLVWCDVERDEMLIRRLVHAAEEFAGHVERREPPAPGGTESDRRAVHALYPRDDGEMLVLPAELLDAADEIEACKAEEKALSSRRIQAENALKIALGPKQCGALPDGRLVQWKTSVRKAYQVAESTSRTLTIKQAKGK